MKEPRHDDERLSALLAGRLEGPERDELLAYLSTADEDREVFANTAAILREMEEEDAQDQEAGVQVADPPPRRHMLPPSTTRRRWSRDPRWAVAAVLVGLVAFVILRPFGGGAVPAGEPVRYALALNSPPGEKPAGWVTTIPGTSTRGDEAPVPTPENSVVAGWFLVRLAVAVQAEDSATTDSLADQLKNRFDRQGGEALERLRARAGEPKDGLMPLVREATNRMEALYDSSFVGLGAWTEAARMAAADSNAAFFQSEDSHDWLGHARTLTRDDPKARAALERVRTLLDAQGERDWNALQTFLHTMLDELARAE